MKRIKSLYIYILSLTEVVILTGIYYFFWRIGYTHGIAGYPEYLGMGKYILMGVYFALTVLILAFTGALRYGRLRAGSIIIRQWGVMLAVNIITYMQLSLTAKHLVAKRPMFDATVAQVIFILAYVLVADFVIKRYSMAGKMLVIGNGIEGETFDGYRIGEIDGEEHSLVDITALFERTDRYDAILIQKKDETSEYLIRHCLEKKQPVYISGENPVIYGVNRVQNEGKSYILVLGLGDEERHLTDRMRAFLT